MTWGDKIRNMTDEELAEFINDIATETSYCGIRCRSYKEGCTYSDSTCRSAWLDWLKQEAKEDSKT